MSTNNSSVTPQSSLLPELPPATYGEAKLGFLGLPGELRNKIYKLVLVHDSPIQIKVPKRSTALLKQENPNNILRTMKQARDEGRDIFCGENTFEVGNGWFGSKSDPNIKGLKNFIKRTTTQSLTMIRNVELGIYFDDRTRGGQKDYFMDIDAFRALLETISCVEECFPSLETLKINSCEKDHASKVQDPFEQAQTWHIYGEEVMLGVAIKHMVEKLELRKITHIQSLDLTTSELARFRRVAFQYVLDAGVEVEEK